MRNAVPQGVIAQASARIHADIQAKKDAKEDLRFGENPVFARKTGENAKPSALSAAQIQGRGELASLAGAPELLDMISKQVARAICCCVYFWTYFCLKDCVYRSSLTPIIADLLGHTDRNVVHTDVCEFWV